MLSADYGAAALVSLAVGVSGLLLALSVSLWQWRAGRNPLHLAYAVALGGWLITLLGRSSGSFIQSHTLALFLSHAASQMGIASLLFFFLISASVIRFETHLIWMAQSVAGLMLLIWSMWAPWLQGWSFALWVAINVVGIIGLVVHGAMKVHETLPQQKVPWLVLACGVLGLGICIADLPTLGLPAQANSVQHYLYAAFLLMLGLAISTRPLMGFRSFQKDAEPQSTAWSAITGFGPQSVSVASAIAGERRRIAQDLHDGVCSQLVSILATLDSRSPHQQGVALALEQCLVDLKMTVDVIDDTDESVIDALASLRYRVQRGLDALGIQMRWVVDIDGPLQSVQGETAKQVLRIAQESLSNVMRHSHATAVDVTCAHLPAQNMLLLEVRDNGRGIPRREADRPGGKGLENMKKRARGMGGRLEISTKPGVGTRLRLLVPVDQLKKPSPSAFKQLNKGF